MHHSPNRRQAVLWGIVSWLLLVAGPLLAVDDGTYTGTTSQGKSISITVSGGSITGYTLGWSCGGSSGTSESFVTCSVDAGGSFSCGNATCPYTPYQLRILLTGTFSDSAVSGGIDFAFYPCLYGCGCCFRSDITYTATPPTPEISINDISIPEGNSGTTTAEFEVTRTYDDGNMATVDWDTSDGTADAVDYTPASGTVIFNSGQTSKVVSVSVAGDTDPEPNEIFYVDLSNASNAAIVDAQGKCTITDDDRTTASVVLPIDGLESMDAYGDPDNYVLTSTLARIPASVVGVGWDVTLETVGASWLSDFVLYFDGSDRDGSGLHVTPGSSDDHSGTQSYSSPVLTLADIGIPDIPILEDGKIYIELYEGWDDYGNSVDGLYLPPSSVTIEHTVVEIFADGFESGDTSAWSSSVP